LLLLEIIIIQYADYFEIVNINLVLCLPLFIIDISFANYYYYFISISC